MKACTLRLLQVVLWAMLAPGLTYAYSATSVIPAISEVQDQEQNLVQLMSLKAPRKQQGPSQLIQFFAELFYKAHPPYLENPLGEADLGDISTQPLYRFDGFDCTTFVETVMALSLARDSADFRKLMNRIRYKDGQVSFFHRNHFPTLDWIPNNERAGFISDVTSSVGPAHDSLTYIEKDNWYLKKGLQVSGPLAKKSWSRVRYVAKEDLLKQNILQAIPSGAIFNVVRPAWDLREAIGTFIDVSHQGFVIHDRGEVYIIHASNGRSRDGQDNSLRVKKDLLRDYVLNVMMNSSTTAGMNFLVVNSKASVQSK